MKDAQTGVSIRFIRQWDTAHVDMPTSADVALMHRIHAEAIRHSRFLRAWQRLGFWLYWTCFDRCRR